MNKKILSVIVAVGFVAIMIYNFKGTTLSTEGYAEKIIADRQVKDTEFKTDDSPLTDEQKPGFEALSYFPVAEKYKVRAEYHKNQSNQIVKINITDGSQREYYVHGNAHFHLEGKELDITVYQPVNAEAEYLFIPFYDKTSADQTYGGGRYVEPVLLGNNTLEIDFNLAYNPYCAYNHNYRCPIPPQNNSLDVAILAGEKMPDFVH